MSLTQGLWRYEKWGYPIIDAPPGAEVWVWFKNGTKKLVFVSYNANKYN